MSRKITVTEKHKAVKQGLMAESEFTRQMRLLYPMYITQYNGFKDTVQILKNKGMLFEDKHEEKDHLFSPEAVQRGCDYELEKKGIDSVTASADDKNKCEKIAIKNLRKDVLYYLNLIAGESKKVDKHDKPVEYKKGNDKDSFNGLKKADLKEEVLDEGAVKNKIYAYAERIFNEFIKARQAGAQISFEDMLGSINANDATNMGMDYKFYINNKENILNALNSMSQPSNVRLKAILKRGIETIKAKYPSVDQSDIMDFIRTHRNDVLGGVDIADEFEDFADANGILVKEPKGGLDKEPGIGAMSVKDIDALPDEEDPITGKKVVMFKEDDIEEKMSDEFMAKAKDYGKQNAFNPKSYELGDMWSSDFDYDGMLRAGLRIRINSPTDQLKQLYSSFEDVNYHRENRHLGRMLDAMEAGDRKEALDAMRDFKIAIDKTLKDISEGHCSTDRKETSEEIEIKEKKGKDHDGDGDIDGDDYMAAKDKAIKKAMGKNELAGYNRRGEKEIESEPSKFKGRDKSKLRALKENFKFIIKDILAEAYTGRLQGYVDGEYNTETKAAAKELMGVLEALESDFLKHRDKLASAYEKAGSYLAPALQAAFLKDLTNQRLSYDKVPLPKTRRLSPEEEDMIRQQRVSEEDKQIVYSKPMNEKK
tara:strand:- start:653 stop:2605 length:1953 start_codon:yes stop_codon:yes gene_type:complete